MAASKLPKQISCLVLLAILATTYAALMAVDLGSEFIKISIVKPGRAPVSIVLNEMSKRKTPAQVRNTICLGLQVAATRKEMFDCAQMLPPAASISNICQPDAGSIVSSLLGMHAPEGACREWQYESEGGQLQYTRTVRCTQVAFVHGDRLLGEEAAALGPRYPDKVYATSRDWLGKYGNDTSVAESVKRRLQPYMLVEDDVRGTIRVQPAEGTTYSAEELVVRGCHAMPVLLNISDRCGACRP
jgi:molecular chaperone DnaK (HSP70)